MTTTRARWDYIERQLMETGYQSLQDDERAICDASDAGTLTLID
jgi:hypothetical protein